MSDICFVANNLYRYLSESHIEGSIGGAELQQCLWVKALTKSGVSCSVVSMDFGQRDREQIGGVEVLKSFKPEAGLRGIRFIYPRIFKLFRALYAARSQAYYVRSASYQLFVVALFCKLFRVTSIYSVAHDTDLLAGKEKIPNIRDRLLYRLGLRMVDKVFVQSESQARLLTENYKKTSTLIRNIVIPVETEPAESNIVLWVATIRSFKRPELFLEMARENTQYSFVMVGGADSQNPELYKEIERESRSIENLEFVGFVTPEQIDRYFLRAKLFVNTSVSEGFPNTFLQSWGCGVPVATFFDPDGVVKKENLGWVLKSTGGLRDVLQNLNDWRNIDSQRVINHVQRAHGTENVSRFIGLIRQ